MLSFLFVFVYVPFLKKDVAVLIDTANGMTRQDVWTEFEPSYNDFGDNREAIVREDMLKEFPYWTLSDLRDAERLSAQQAL